METKGTIAPEAVIPVVTTTPEKYGDGDAALMFLSREHEAGVVDIAETSALRWKIDLRIMPILMSLYFLQYLDKTLLNYAAVMGIKDNLKGNEYNNIGTIFYVGYLVAEPITAYLMQRFPIGKYTGINVACWGILVACHAACQSYASLMVVRVLLGVFEASVAPSLILITGMWWTKPEQSRRTGLWYSQIGVAQIVGPAISYGFQHVNSAALANWQILFLFMGCLTTMVGIAIIFLLPDNPMSASFLSTEEKIAAIEHVRVNQTGVENKHFKPYQVVELLLNDKETWPLLLITLLAMIDNGAVSNFSSIIIATFGFSTQRTTIIQMPSGAVSIIATVGATYLIGYSGHRSYMIAIITIPSILGAGLLLGLDEQYKVGKLFGVYLLNACPAILPIIYSWNSANTSGYTKRVMRNALTLMAFCVGNLIGPQLFQSSDAPSYNAAKITLIVSMSAVVVLALALRQLMVWENAKRDQEQAGHEVEASAVGLAFSDLTDIQNRQFRYVY
ncbi:major facilitator superfamily domain-containing protein [Aspergillus lucknowensis]|uniref:Major facilitator superfamily domain-containing protein n=1 Tax=Aspergillus lucknowensis TaxID=176173 RepID=A0ABR4M4F6_9EURO